MKTSIVNSDWLPEQVRRLDAGPYLSGGFEAKKTLQIAEIKKDYLVDVTSGYKGGIYNGPKFARVYHNHPEHSVDFLTTTGMMQADFSNLPKLKKKDAESKKLSFLKLQKGTSLISCSGTIGRMAYVGNGLDGVWSCQDMIKVRPNEEKIGSGYLYAFLNSKFGVPMVLSGTYGAVIKHIEPEHIQDMPVPRLSTLQEDEIDRLIKSLMN
ncbi:restriction endonuclease subunit S [Photobacterium leiognathi]|uniref:restriction endonuclease subunit S n=1 Tax=Photobacterium leiognathi TaxID=553611 RepID=UPI0027340058|nr:restriction endonuclease subunit S [Photobacterium leiognathi]